MSTLINIKTGKKYVPAKGELDPDSEILHDVISNGKLVYRTSKELLILRGIVREEPDVIIPDEILTSAEMKQKILRKNSKNVHEAKPAFAFSYNLSPVKSENKKQKSKSDAFPTGIEDPTMFEPC